MILGDLDPWADSFPEGLVGEVIELLIAAWESLPPFVGWPIEDAITRSYVTRIRADKRAKRLPFSILGQYELVDATTGDIVGIIDLCVVTGYREEVYLAFECKRLNVPNAKGAVVRRAWEYVDQGMMRFVEGRYAGATGGMVGYVLDRDVPGAMAAVAGSITTHATRLGVSGSPPLRPSAHSARANVRESEHLVGANTRVLQHLFLAWP